MKHRQSRVRELILRELGAVISREMTFAAKLVTVSDVSLTPDFKNCHAHISVIGTEDDKRHAIQALADRRPLLQSELSRRVVLKYTPQLHFHLDDSIERGSKIVSILEELDLPPAEEEEYANLDNPPETLGAASVRVAAPTAAEAAADMVDADEDDAEPVPAAAPRRRSKRR